MLSSEKNRLEILKEIQRLERELELRKLGIINERRDQILWESAVGVSEFLPEVAGVLARHAAPNAEVMNLLMRQIDELKEGLERIDSTTSEEDLSERAKWLKDELDKRRWSKHDLARETSVKHETIQKILDGKRVVQNTIDKLRRTLPNLK
jgi:hypothetical protein